MCMSDRQWYGHVSLSSGLAKTIWQGTVKGEKKTRPTEEEVGRQHQGMDRPGVRQVPEGSGEEGKMEKTGCEIICGAPTTLVVNGWMMMMMMKYKNKQFTYLLPVGFLWKELANENLHPVLFCLIKKLFFFFNLSCVLGSFFQNTGSQLCFRWRAFLHEVIINHLSVTVPWKCHGCQLANLMVIHFQSWLSESKQCRLKIIYTKNLQNH